MITIAAAIGATAIVLPADPLQGFAVDAHDFAYLASSGRIDKYRIGSNKLQKVQSFAETFGPNLEMLPTSKGLIIVDYEKETVGLYSYKGVRDWQTRVVLPNIARIDGLGQVWFCLQSGSMAWKTSDSSEVESMLGKAGDELFFPWLLDFSTAPNGAFYAMSLDRQMLRLERDGARRPVGKAPKARRILASKGGGVLMLEGPDGGQRIVHIADNADQKTIWTAPADIPKIEIFGRTGKGHILLAAKTDVGGLAYIVEVAE
ncbi:MAG: hypothetical protein H0W86_07720 [Armatimonadetes bacterium]|nr:hypothetical protein [Armatimonadota bacterium]